MINDYGIEDVKGLVNVSISWSSRKCVSRSAGSLVVEGRWKIPINKGKA